MFRADSESLQLLEINDKGRLILGIQSNIFSMESLFCNDSDRKYFKDEIAQKGLISNFDVEVKTADKRSVWLSIEATLFFEEGIIEGSFNDVTEGKNSYLDLQHANKELEHFAFHVSHDLRSPLKSLMGLIDSIREENRQEQLSPYFSMMKESISRMDMLIKDLLELAMLNQQSVKKEKILLEPEINKCIQSLSYLKNYHNFNFLIEIENGIDFFSDVVRIRTILSNLISNAIKYHRQDQVLVVKITGRILENKVKISVEDNGTGIDPEHQKKIFNMFYRANSDCEGSGLGLYIVKNNIEKLGGKIELQSIPGIGTSFDLEIPNTILKPEIGGESLAYIEK